MDRLVILRSDSDEESRESRFFTAFRMTYGDIEVGEMSMVPFGRSIEKAKDLRRTMRRMKIFEKDIKETFIRSSGPGGQNVNKVSTCVALIHHPTGVQVKSQQERTQGLNRYKARCQLIEKIEQKQRKARQKIIQDRAKKKRQNRKRPKALKEKILEGKKQQAQKKKSRQRIRPHKLNDLM